MKFNEVSIFPDMGELEASFIFGFPVPHLKKCNLI
jgi:hypothetical protein